MSHSIAAIILAAGRGSRMAASNPHASSKMLRLREGVPLLHSTITAVVASAADPVVVVTGHDAAAIIASLPASLSTCARLRCVYNPDYALGLSTSLRSGLANLPETTTGALICLGDMPDVRSNTLDHLIAMAHSHPTAPVLLPKYQHHSGNPLLWHRRCFPQLMALRGDQGARSLLPALTTELLCVPVDDPGILIDYDIEDDLH